jgi:hypothetical protein
MRSGRAVAGGRRQPIDRDDRTTTAATKSPAAAATARCPSAQRIDTLGALREPLTALSVPLMALSVPLTALSVPLMALSVPLTALSVPLKALSVPFTALSVPFTSLSVPLTALSVPFTALSSELRRAPPAGFRTHPVIEQGHGALRTAIRPHTSGRVVRACCSAASSPPWRTLSRSDQARPTWPQPRRAPPPPRARAAR